MRGFLLGVVATVIVGGCWYVMQTNYGTLDTCTAVQKTLADGVVASIQRDIQQQTGSGIVGKMANILLQPVADPLIANEVRQETKGRNWLQCALDLIQLDVLGGREARVAVIKNRLLTP